MLTSVASDGMVVSDTPMEEGSGGFFLSLLMNDRLTLMEEVSGVFFLSLLTSLSLCTHSLLSLALTLMEEVSGVFFLSLLTSLSLCAHSSLSLCTLTHNLCYHSSHTECSHSRTRTHTSHLIDIPVFT